MSDDENPAVPRPKKGIADERTRAQLAVHHRVVRWRRWPFHHRCACGVWLPACPDATEAGRATPRQGDQR